MNSAEALALIRRAATLGQIRLTKHARERMSERGASVHDVRHSLANASRCAPAEGDRWRTTGLDLDGDELTAVVVIDGDVIVVTVF